jgi:hypothetical protein
MRLYDVEIGISFCSVEAESAEAALRKVRADPYRYINVDYSDITVQEDYEYLCLTVPPPDKTGEWDDPCTINEDGE